MNLQNLPFEELRQNVGYVLEQFGTDETRARRAYRQFVAKGVRQGRRPELSGGLIRSVGEREKVAELRRCRKRWMSDEQVLGSGKFVS